MSKRKKRDKRVQLSKRTRGKARREQTAAKAGLRDSRKSE